MNVDTPAPVLLFTYKRLDTLKQTVAALQQNFLAEESDLFIFSDAGKNEDDNILIAEIRAYLHTITGFKTVKIIEAEQNKGLANSIIAGVAQIINEYKKVIVLEDDLVTSSNFLSFMNHSLIYYQNNPQVFSIAGYTIPVTVPAGYNYDGYFLPRASSWGWATWINRWDKVDWKVSSFSKFKNDRSQIKAFNEGGSDMYSMLKKQMEGKVDSWAIRWCYQQFISKSYTLYPVISKIKNVGFNNMATHTHVFNRYNTSLDTELKRTFKFPAEVKPDSSLLSQFQSFYSIKSRSVAKIKTYLYKAGLNKNEE